LVHENTIGVVVALSMDQGEDFQVKKLHISLQSSLLSLDLQG